MSKTKDADAFINSFENLSEPDQKEVTRKLMFKFCNIAMKDKTIMQEMMPQCMEMMSGKDFPMKAMMSQMMSNPR